MSKKHELIATAFDKKGNIIGAGVNDYKKSHPLMKVYSDKVKDTNNRIFKHAELSAVLAAGNKDIHSVLIQRFNAQGNPALAKPCKICEAMLKDFGVKFVRYTSSEGIKRDDY